MSGLSTTSELAALALLFNNTAWPNIGDAGGLQPSVTAGSFFAGLATAALTAASTQVSSQATYTGYTRVGVARSGAGWTISGSDPAQAVNAAAITFPTAGSGPQDMTDFCVGLASGTGAGVILFYGPLNGAPITVANGDIPSFAPGDCVCTLK